MDSKTSPRNKKFIWVWGSALAASGCPCNLALSLLETISYQIHEEFPNVPGVTETVRMALFIPIIVAAPIACLFVSLGLPFRIVLVVSTILYVIFGSSIFFIHNLTAIVTLRCLFGVATGMLEGVSMALMPLSAEFYPKSITRPMLAGGRAAFGSLVACICTFAAPAISKHVGWRPLCLLCLIVVLYIPAWCITPDPFERQHEDWILRRLIHRKKGVSWDDDVDEGEETVEFEEGEEVENAAQTTDKRKKKKKTPKSGIVTETECVTPDPSGVRDQTNKVPSERQSCSGSKVTSPPAPTISHNMNSMDTHKGSHKLKKSRPPIGERTHNGVSIQLEPSEMSTDKFSDERTYSVCDGDEYEKIGGQTDQDGDSNERRRNSITSEGDHITIDDIEQPPVHRRFSFLRTKGQNGVEGDHSPKQGQTNTEENINKQAGKQDQNKQQNAPQRGVRIPGPNDIVIKGQNWRVEECSYPVKFIPVGIFCFAVQVFNSGLIANTDNHLSHVIVDDPVGEYISVKTMVVIFNSLCYLMNAVGSFLVPLIWKLFLKVPSLVSSTPNYLLAATSALGIGIGFLLLSKVTDYRASASIASLLCGTFGGFIVPDCNMWSTKVSPPPWLFFSMGLLTTFTNTAKFICPWVLSSIATLEDTAKTQFQFMVYGVVLLIVFLCYAAFGTGFAVYSNIKSREIRKDPKPVK